jgi:MFS family permease
MIREYVSTLSRFNLNLKLLMSRTIFMGLYAGIYGIIFNLYILDMGFRADFLGVLLAVSLLTSSVMSIPAGILCDRFDRRKLMVVSSVLSLLAVIPIFLFPSPLVLLFFSAVYGVFSAISAVCLTPVLAENCAEDTVHVFSANASLGWIASVAGCAIGGLMPGLMMHFTGMGDGYRLTLLASVALLVVGCILLALMKKGGCATVQVRHRKKLSLKDLKPSSTVIKFTLTSMTFGVASGMIVPYFNIYFMKVLNVGVVEIGMASAAAGAFMIIGFIATPLLTARIGKVRSAVLSKVLSAPFLLLMALTTDFFLASVAYVGYMFLINMAGPATTSFQMEQIHPKEQGFAMGLMSTGNCLAVSASSFVSGILIANGNFKIPFMLTCAGYLLTAALIYHYFKDYEPSFRVVPMPLAVTAPEGSMREGS